MLLLILFFCPDKTFCSWLVVQLQVFSESRWHVSCLCTVTLYHVPSWGELTFVLLNLRDQMGRNIYSFCYNRSTSSSSCWTDWIEGVRPWLWFDLHYCVLSPLHHSLLSSPVEAPLRSRSHGDPQVRSLTYNPPNLLYEAAFKKVRSQKDYSFCFNHIKSNHQTVNKRAYS